MAQSGVKTDRHASIVFFGSPLIDLTAAVDSAFLERYNLEPDNAYSVDETTRRIFDDIRPSCSVQIGGSVTNTVRAFFKRRPREDLVTYLGSVGNDKFGELIVEGLAGLGAGLSRADAETGKVAVLLTGKARTLVTDLGASRIFHLDVDSFQVPDFVYFSGFFIGVSAPTIARILEKTAAEVIFNLGAPFLCTKFPEQMVQLYRNSSIVFGNQAEHLAFARINNITSPNLKPAVVATNRLFPNRSRVVVVTRGGASVLVFRAPDWWEFEVTSLEDAQIVDTSGAGDAFVGGFLARHVDGDSVANCVAAGIEMARFVIQSVGFNVE